MDTRFRTPVKEVDPATVPSVPSGPGEMITVGNQVAGDMDVFEREPSFIAFDISSSGTEVTDPNDSDILSEKGREYFVQQEWVDKDGEVVSNIDDMWRMHHLARTELGRELGRGRPPTPVLKRMLKGDSTQEKFWPEAGKWRREKRRYMTRKDEALGEDNASWVDRHLAPPKVSSNVENAEMDSCNTDTPIFLNSSAGTKYTSAMTAPIRFCLFNTGRLNRREIWSILKERMTPEILDGVVRVQAVRQPNGYPRMDLWIEARVASNLKKSLYLLASQRRIGVKRNYKFPLYKLREFWIPNGRTSKWRLDFWKPWRDRLPERRPQKEASPQPFKGNIATLNINGMGAKKPLLENFVEEHAIGVLAIQETLLDINAYSFYLEGYEMYVREKREGFRGQMLLVHRSHPSYEVSRGKYDCFIHVKVAKFRGPQPWHFLSVYLPSGGSRRTERTECLKQILKEYDAIMEKEPDARIIVLGDFNIKRHLLSKRINTAKTALACLEIMGDGLTFHRKGTKWSDVDSILISPGASKHLDTAEVLKDWLDISDHFPLIASLAPTIERENPPSTQVNYRFNVDLIKGHGKCIVNSNRWKNLPMYPITTEEELDESATTFCTTINEEALELGIKQQVLDGRIYLNRTLKRKVEKVTRLRKDWELARARGSAEEDHLLRLYKLEHASVRKALRKRKAQLHEKEVQRVTKLFHNNEMKAFHRWESQMTKGKRIDTVKPVVDKLGNLITDEDSIRNRIFEYYRDLKQDDPEKVSRDTAHWVGKCAKRADSTLPGINETPTWTETLLAIRKMALGTAPGHDDIPVELYKSLLKEECHAHLAAQGTIVGDNIYVALPEKDLPFTPQTCMGQHLFRIILGIWSVERQPEFWSRVTDKSLHKAGDPTDLKNYRAISLIVVAMKVVTAMLANRISATLESQGLIVKEQGGFRRHEEAIAQFITLAEIVRRRRLKNHKTYIVFVDLLKAFDKVMHEALMEKLDAMGFRGKFLHLLRSIYHTSKACIRVGDKPTGFYDMIVGVRQGCPLSPILFLIFINDLLDYLPEGVHIPGIKDNSKCAALMFADDIAGLAETPEGAQALLDGITRWSKDWRMPVGAPKCGVMMVGGTEEEQQEFALKCFTAEEKSIPVVRKYKYLGIWITDKFGDSDQTDENAHCKLLASRVKTAVDMRRAFLRDLKYPLEVKLAVIHSKIISLGIYGGEWVGMCQKRTNIIQSEVNKALKLVLGSPINSKLHATRILSWELNTPTIEERMADLRVRLWQKAPSMKTWIADLTRKENKLQSRSRVWSNQTAWFIKNTLNSPFMRDSDVPDVKTTWFYRTLLNEGKIEHIGSFDRDEDPETARKWDRQQVLLHIIERSFGTAHRNANEATKVYTAGSFGESRRYIKAAAHLPHLSKGVVWMARIRTSAWWSSRRRRDFLKASNGDYSHLPEEKCPLCLEDLTVGRLEIHHILYDCPMWHKEREQWLRPLIDFLSGIILSGGGRTPPNGDYLEGEITTALFGGRTDPSKFDESIGPEYPDWRGGWNPAPALKLFEKGWGGQPEYIAPYMSTHGFIPLAMFLAAIMPKHKACLLQEEGKKPKTRYRQHELEHLNRCAKWLHEDGSALDDGGEYELQDEPNTTPAARQEFYQTYAQNTGMVQVLPGDALDFRRFESPETGTESEG